MRLIDADGLLDKIVNIPSKVEEKTFYDKQSDLLTGSAYRQNEIIDIVNDMPTVEQKHGHWIDTGNGMKCSFCSLFWDYYYWSSPMFEKFDWMMNYWPSCGAKMDGKCEVENVTNNT